MMASITPSLNKTVVVKRRPSTPSRDDYNAPIYGAVSTWTTAYSALKCRIETMEAPIQFKPSGERVLPTPKMYVEGDIVMYPEDRVIDGTTTYIVQGVVPKWAMAGTGVNHYEIDLLIEP